MLLRGCITLLFCFNLLNNIGVLSAISSRLHGYENTPGNGPGSTTFTITADFDDAVAQDHGRYKREASSVPSTPGDNNLNTTVNYLNDTHKQMMVHWCKNQAIVCLAKDPPGTDPITPSSVYISYDYGDHYIDKTSQFKLDNSSNAIIEKFFVHPEYNENIIFNDIMNKVIFVTADTGKTFVQHKLNFTPSDISFHKFQPNVFLIFDTSNSNRMLWMTEDFGKSWVMIQEYVKSYFWIEDKNNQLQLVFERVLPSNLSTVFYTNKQQKLNTYALEVEKVNMKNDYIFTAMKSKRHSYDIFVSYKFGKKIKCVFDTTFDITDYLLIDVDSNAQRALIAVRHTNTMSNLYVSENLHGREDKVHFTLSMPNVMAHFPNATWQNSWLHLQAEEAFADVYKVEGVSGIYIASQVISKPTTNEIGPSHLGSRISFDHGASWRPIAAPTRDMEGQLTPCALQTNNTCSLHLSQKFSQLYPDTKSVSILSSKSAPGVIMATGVMGQSLKGIKGYGVFISSDAGITWRYALRNYYFFNIGDHGGIMIASENLRMRGEVSKLLYSTDEGENWVETSFHNKDIRLYALMTQPEEKTTVFTMFGSLPNLHQWMIVKVDLRNVFKYNCSEDDFKLWSPTQKDENDKYVPCILGKQKQYKRKIAHANCYTGIDYNPSITEQACECEQIDYECDFGFVRSGDKHWHCVKDSNNVKDPYVIPATCRPGETYNRTKGYRKISGDICLDGYVNQFVPDIIPCPTTHMNNMLLYAKRENIVQVDLITLKQTNLTIPNLKNVIAIDFDLSNNCVYWADIVTDTIARFCDNNGSPIEYLVASDLISVEGMALDWISKNLYFVDGLRAKIELVRTDIHYAGRMRRTILDEKELIKPRGIAVHPKAGYLFWTDWASTNPAVKRSNLDGSNIKVIADKKLVEWPNGISIDYIAERVYWVDARKDYIASANFDGLGFKKVNLDNMYVSHPFAVAVFKDELYWDDWRMDSIFVSNKDFGGSVRSIVANVTGLMDIKVIAHGTQHGTNKCGQTPSPCTNICVGSPAAPYYRCLCPDGMEMKNNKCVCPGGAEPFANYTCPKVSGSCSSAHFACTTGTCIPNTWRCDNENDCGDNSDEANCGARACPEHHFVCSDGKCIPHYWKCDYEPDCADNSDEMNCPRHNCSANQFTCNNGRCISERWRCDGENDCRDNSDEINCAKSSPVTCKSDEFTCSSGNVKCISLQWRCDGDKDCNDNSDEENCDKNHTCTDLQFSCQGPDKIGECIYKSWVCDGDIDCHNGADEKNCTYNRTTIKPPYINPFAPINGSGCQDWMFTCANNKCIPIWWKCDHANDCEDGSDEIGCNFTTPAPIQTPETTSWDIHVCDNYQFQCGTGECISMSWVCDKTFDCENGDDEKNCNERYSCNERHEFKCRIDGNCISQTDVCNGKQDCPDGSDEEFCATRNNLPGTATPSCSVGYFPCDLNRCFPLASMCDSKHDCNDGFDEGEKCSNITRVFQVLQMGVDARSVNEKSVLLYWWISLPEKLKLEFLPSICNTKDMKWQNMTWTNETKYRFDKLEPNNTYNMTVYVRVNGSDASISPPAKYFLVRTSEGVPSEPYNLTVQQLNDSDIILTWNSPLHPNGVITFYEIFWYPPNPPIALRLSDNSTAHILTADFEPDVKYSFYVIAHNHGHTSEKSEVKTLMLHDIGVIKSLDLVNLTSNSVSLSWTCLKDVDGFMVVVDIKLPYPKQPNYITVSKNITINNLPSAARMTIKIYGFKNLYRGSPASITLTTLGDPLPSVRIKELSLLKNIGTSVKVAWDRPKDNRKANWVYGIYYGVTMDELLSGARMNTTDLSATVHDLNACEYYMFSVGVIAPLGAGPIARNASNIFTFINNKAAPKKLSVQMNPNNHLQMLVQWSPSCPNQKNEIAYTIEITDKIVNKKNTVTVVNATGAELSKVFNVSYGGVYEIRIKTFVENSIFTDPITYRAPPIMPPHQVSVVQELHNGSYVVFWSERNISKTINDYIYEVFVSEGPELNLTSASKYVVKAPPFIFNNHTAAMYSFAVRLKTQLGYRSVLSETVSFKNEALSLVDNTSESGGWSIWIPVCFLVVILVSALGFLWLKYRRLQHNFTRFANSHYDTRSEAATFDDNILDEDDTPQIRGFSDDEPLVLA